MERQPAKKFAVFLVAAFIIFGAIFFPLRPAKAIPVEDIPALVWNKITDFAAKLWRTAGSVAFQRTLTTALNKIAYDTATWIGSGHQGQKPLFITQGWGDYLLQVGDEAGGQFLETFVNNLGRDDSLINDCDSSYENCVSKCVPVSGVDTAFATCMDSCAKQSTACITQNASTINVTPSFNVCAPSSLSAKLKIGLGLVEQNRPQGPNCTISEIVKNWSTDSLMAAAGLGGTGLTGEEYLRNFADFFDPRSNDLGIYASARSDMLTAINEKAGVEASYLAANKGWLDVRNIAGETSAPPGTAERELESAKRSQETNIGTITGDAFVDAANVFINQYAMSAFNELMRSLSDRNKAGGSAAIQASLANPFSDPRAYYGVSSLTDATTKLLEPDFGVRADYNILSSLVICPDPSNPGPDNCVIDDQFMQAISEKKTVAEAISGNYLHGEWQFTNENIPSTYSLRNISILRKYRIVPAGWETAVQKITAVNPPKKATLNDLVSCFDKTDRHTTFSVDFDQRDQNWCEGLVDPNWVLKAPLNYCRQEGVSAQILNKSILPSGNGTSTVLSVIRADGYCADNQTCIKEKPDGSCESYGYCNEEKRTWNFGNGSCTPINNTCQSFTGPTGASIAYLQNTLDYGDCNPENSGCRQYALTGTYNNDTRKVAWNGSFSTYFNKSMSSCDAINEGCTSLLRVKPTWGSNLVMNSSFKNDKIGDTSVGNRLNDWPLNNSQGVIVDAAIEPGGMSGVAIKLTTTGATGGLYSDQTDSLLPIDYQTIPGQAYTVSADVYLVAGDSVRIVAGSSVAEGYVKSTTVKNNWQRLSITRPANVAYNSPEFYVTGVSASGGAVFYVRNLKFEMGNWDTGASAYGSYNVYQKLLPSYLEQACYVDAVNADYRLKDGAPNVCSNFARRCNKSEVGCESYSSIVDGFTVSAQVTSSDYCSDQCLGYDSYIAKSTYFQSSASDNIIPATANTCTAAAVGCTEFTNLDEINQGGERKEYYSILKQCIKPSTSSCATFYSWEGTDSGYQLRAYSLKKDSNNLPAVTSNDSSLCNATIYRLPVTDSGYNSDCREYYNVAGQVSYHLSSRTITCSDNCHAYRMTEKNVDLSLNSAGQCAGVDKHWDAAASTCYSCLNGGTWDNTRNACVYQAIPGEGNICQAVENNCREYSGSRGANVRLVAAFDFENGLNGWGSNCTGGVTVSSISNSNGGQSARYNNNVSCGNAIGESAQAISRQTLIERLLAGENLAAQLSANQLVKQGNAYTVRFLARASSNTAIKIFFLDPSTNTRSYFNQGQTLVIKGGNEWNIYQANLDVLDHSVDSNEKLIITADNTFNFDDFVLSEITDRYYLIRNSSQIPNACYYDIFYNYQGAEYNLGCNQYSDRSGLKHNLHRFSSLCSDSAVGCEQMIDTKNYDDYGPGYWQAGEEVSSCSSGDSDCLIVPGDTAIYAVYDQAKSCSSANQGCSRLGEGQGGANLIGWTDVFKKNNPDKYSSTLCGLDEVGCEAWKNNDNSQLSYFKDPGTEACLYRESNTPGVVGKNWYRIPVRRCDLNGDGSIKNVSGFVEQDGPLCTSDDSCANSRKCIVDSNDYSCSFTFDKTFGFGGANNQIPVPDKQAGLCDANQSSCTEYIDPVSKSVANIVINPAFALSDGRREGWGINSVSGWSGVVAADQQFLRIKPNKIYSLLYRPSSEGGSANGTVSLTFLNSVKPLLVNNQLGSTTTVLTISASNQPIIFNSFHNDFSLLSGGAEDKYIEVKELIVDYQLQKNIDKESCNGLTDFNNGCVLFDERSVTSSVGPTDLTNAWDPYATSDRQTPQLCSPGSDSCRANQLIKVRPDRVCAKWLDCISYIQDPYTKKKTCYAFAECDRLDDKGECSNFINIDAASNKVPQINQNSTGYSLPNKYNMSGMEVVGRSITDLNGDFDSGGACGNYYCFVDTPDEATTDYPADGPGYLTIKKNQYYQFPTTFSVRSAAADEYFINYLLNTKDSGGASGIIDIEYDDVRISLEDKSETGWSRKIRRFQLSPGIKNVTIKLRASSAGDVHFDDVSVEPVLKTSATTYAVPECRLYPTNDSLTCFSKNENVIANGLQGYCLEKDSRNPNVCLLWYPMDNLPLPSISKMGYSGNFPLNYCTQVSGNFDFMEYRRGSHEAYKSEDHIRVYNASGHCLAAIGDPPGNSCDQGSGGGTYYGCFEFDNAAYVQYWDGYPRETHAFCSPDYNLLISSTDCGSSCEDHYHFMCIPKESGLRLIDNASANYGNSINHSGDNNWGACQNKIYSTGYAVYNGFDSGFTNTQVEAMSLENDPTPNLKIYDYEDPPTRAADLKFIPGTMGGAVINTNVNYYHFTCNQLAQTVDANGTGASWVERTKSGSEYLLNNALFKNSYSQNLSSPPFGGLIANIVDGSGVVSLQDLTTDPLAGRPYGCINGTGENCYLVGVCSGDPSTYCLATTTPVGNPLNQITCSGKGTCQPLWNANELVGKTSAQNFTRATEILKNIFLKSYSVLTKPFGSQKYSVTGQYYDHTAVGNNDLAACPGGVRPYGAYCYILPKIENIKLFFNDNPLVLAANSYDIKQKGIYRFEFNTTVDKEQQPLKKIVIDWGDGYSQTITNQDNMPPSGSPHVIYHYYNKTGPKSIRVEISDNWYFYCDTGTASSCWQ